MRGFLEISDADTIENGHNKRTNNGKAIISLTYLFISFNPLLQCWERGTGTVLHVQNCLFDDYEGSHFDSFFLILLLFLILLRVVCVRWTFRDFYERSSKSIQK